MTGPREGGVRLDRLILRPVQEKEAEPDRGGENRVLRITVDNNCIHRLGTVWHGCYGIVNRFASFSRITHNDIFDTHWDAIGLDARWKYQGEKYSHGNEVAYNHLHHLGLRYHTDAGGVYQFGPLDTHIHHNRIHDTRAYPYICGFAGVYLDMQSRGALVENNLVYNVEWPAYFQHKGVENTFRNNIGAFARDGLLLRGALNEEWQANHFEAVRNIYVTDGREAIARLWETGTQPPVMGRNMYWSTSAGTDLLFADGSFEEWQQGLYGDGAVVGDPGFVDAAALDFRLRKNAPAVDRIGFVPFDEEIRRAGLYGPEPWRRLPETVELREPAPVWSDRDLAGLLAFRMDFEELSAGARPNRFRLAGATEEATFAVTDEKAAAGAKAYRCTDRKGLRKPYYPYIHMESTRLNEGQVTFAFDAALDDNAPAPFFFEMRGAGSVQDAGPSIHFQADGTVIANGETILETEPGEWARFTVRLDLDGDDPHYRLATEHARRREERTLPYRHDSFGEIRWLGFSACQDVDGAFYLDNLCLELE